MDHSRTSPLFAVIYNDRDLSQIRDLLAAGKDPNCQVYGGFAPIHHTISVKGENFKVFQELINAGADVNLSTHCGYTPLHFAVMYRRQRFVDALIKQGALVNAKTFLGHTALQFAVTERLLNIQPEQYNIRPDLGIISKLLDHKDIDRDTKDSNGDTALMTAVKCEKPQAVNILLQNGANPNICNYASKSPLHVAFAQEFVSFTEIYLLLNGANIDSVDKNGKTPLDILLKNRSRSFHNIKSLLKLIAFKYNITYDLKLKLQWDLETWQFFESCCNEVEQMRKDFIYGNLTLHDFVWNCFNESQFQNIQLQLYKPLVERLTKDIYSEYFSDIFGRIPVSILHVILETTVRSRKETKYETIINLGYLFMKTDFIHLICEYLSNVELFCLIIAFSKGIIVKSLQNLYERESSYVIYLNRKRKIFKTLPK